jgi:hypothetical protein
MGHDIPAPVKEVNELFTGLRGVVQSFVEKRENGITGLELAQILDENSAKLEVGLIGADAALEAFQKYPLVVAESSYAFVVNVLCDLIAKPEAVIEKSEIGEIFDALAAYTSGLMSRLVDGFQISDAYLPLLSSSEQIVKAVEGSELIGQQFSQNLRSQLLLVGEASFALTRQILGAAEALRVARGLGAGEAK